MMKNILMTGLLMFASNWFKRLNPYSHASFDLTKLKIAMGYLQTVKTIRLLFISLLGAGACLVFLLSGIVLFHVAVALYAPWSMSTKMIVMVGCASFYVLSALGIFMYIFSEDKWLKIFNADKMIKELSGENGTPAAQTDERTEFARRSSL